MDVNGTYMEMTAFSSAVVRSCCIAIFDFCQTVHQGGIESHALVALRS